MKIIYFDPVATSATNPQYPLSNLAFGLQRGWVAPSSTIYPATLVLCLKERARLNSAILCSSKDNQLAQIVFQISDALGSQTASPFKLLGTGVQVGQNYKQVPLMGIGKFVKLTLKPKGKCAGLKAISFFGESLSYGVGSLQARNENTEKADQIMLQLGIRPRIDWSEGIEYAPISIEARRTYIQLQRKSRAATNLGDYGAVKQLQKDMAKVYQIGRKMLDLQNSIKICLAKQDYESPIQINKQYIAATRELDRFDVLYQTARYFQGIQLGEQSQLMRRILEQQAQNERRLAEEQRQKAQELRRIQQKLDQQNGRKQKEGKPWFKADLGEDQPVQKIIERKIEIEPASNYKNEFMEDQKPEIKQEPSEPAVDQLEGFLSPELAGLIIDPADESMQKYRDLHYLERLGERVWYGIVSANWKYRQAAAKSVLNYVEAGLPAKYKGQSKQFFEAVVEFARNCCTDKVLSVYFMGLSIFQSALAPPICGPDVSPQSVNNAIKQFTQILISKIEQLNSSASDKSLPVLLSIYKHPAADIRILATQALKVCSNPTADAAFKPIHKQPPRIPLSRMKVLLLGLMELPSLKKQVKQIGGVLFGPCLIHPSAQVRTRATDGLLFLEQFSPGIFDLSIEKQKQSLRPAVLEGIEDRRTKFSKQLLLKALNDD